MSDGLASIRQWKIAVIAGGFHAVIPSRPAVDWIEAAFTGDFMALLDDADAERLTEAIFDGQVEMDAVERMMFDAIAEAAGREWHIAGRLCGCLLQSEFCGEVIMRVDLERVSFAAALDAIYSLAVRYLDKDKRAEWDAQLNAPAPITGSLPDPRSQAAKMRERTLERGGAISGQSGPRRPRSQLQLENGHQDG